MMAVCQREGTLDVVRRGDAGACQDDGCYPTKTNKQTAAAAPPAALSPCSEVSIHPNKHEQAVTQLLIEQEIAATDLPR